MLGVNAADYITKLIQEDSDKAKDTERRSQDMKENKTQKYFYVRATDEVHRQVKLNASMQGVSIQEYISNILMKELQQAKEANE